MGCERCGASTSWRYCKQCEQFLRTENDTLDGTAVYYECPACGEERSSGRDTVCWLCSSDRYEEGDDGQPELVTDGGRTTYRRYEGDPDDHEYGDARVGYNVPKTVRHSGAYKPLEKRELSGNGTSFRGHCVAFECPRCGHVQRFATNEFVTWGECRGCSTRSVAFEFNWRLNR